MEIFIMLFMVAGVIALARAALGPTWADRYLGVSVFASVLTLTVAFYGITMGREFFLDIAIALVMLSFVGSLAIAKYSRGKKEV